MSQTYLNNITNFPASSVVVWREKAGSVPSPRPSVELKPTVGEPVSPIPSPLPPPVSSREAMVTTSKNIYTRGENIKILIKNEASPSMEA